MRLESCAIAIALVLVLTTHAAAPVAAAIRINELLPGPATDWNGDGSVSSRDDEWVEIVNTGASSETLDGLLLTDATGLPRYGFTGSLAPGARVVVYGSDAYDWERANGHPAFGLSLGNTGDTLRILRVAGPDTTEVDVCGYLAHQAGADRSTGRLPDGEGGWTLFDGLNPYAGGTAPTGTGCAPTPGAANACASTPVARGTWGRVKALFR